MTTFEMIKLSIEAKKKRGTLTSKFIEDTKKKMDVFLMADRINANEFDELTKMLAE